MKDFWCVLLKSHVGDEGNIGDVRKQGHSVSRIAPLLLDKKPMRLGELRNI